MFLNIKNTTMKKYLLTLQLFALPLFFYAQTKTVTFSTVGSTSFYVPAGVPSVIMAAWGGGGAGGGSTSPGLSLQRAGAGGGGGAFAGGTYSMNIAIQNTLSITVGKGGVAATSANGGAGDSSSITGYVIALPGSGGTVNNGSASSPAGGPGGLASGSTGTTKVDGVNGGDGQTLLPAVTGAGGAGATSGANIGGAGGASIGTLLANSDGNPGTQPGGGGSGSKSALLGPAGKGGAGGAGSVVITYTCPTYSLTSTSASTVNICSSTSSTITLNGTLPVGLYSVAYQLDGVTQTPASMTVTTSGTGTFVVSGLTVLGTKSLVINSLTSGTSVNAADNCASAISANNSTSITVSSSGTAPVALVGSGATCTQITANWQSVVGSTYYTLDLSTDINFGSFVGTYNGLNVGNVLTTNITGLSNATTYYYRVRAFNGTCLSAYSNTITYKPAVSPGNVVLQPATSIVCSVFTANWTAEANAVSYLLDVSLVNNFATTLPGYGSLDIGNVTTYTVTGLSPGTTYYYRVRSKNGCGTSATGTATVQNVTTLNTIPDNVVSSAATSTNCSVFNANWTTVANATSYLLDVSTSNTFASFVISGLDVGNVSTYQVTGLTQNTTYYYRIKGKNSCGNSAAFSSTQSLTTLNSIPTVPASVAASAIGCTQFTVSWNAATNALTYDVQISTDSGFPATSATQLFTGITATNYSPTGLTSGTVYYYRVRAINGCGTTAYGIPSPTFTTTLALPATPTNDPPVQPTCDLQTGTVVLKGLPNRTDYTIVQTGTTSNSYTGGSGADYTKYTISGLIPGTYNFTVSYPGSCASMSLQNIVINALVTNTYTTAGGWSLGTPTVNQNVIFADDFSTGGDLNSCSCTINAGKKITVNSGHTLVVKNALVVDATTGTSITFKTSSSLMQVNSAVNSGNITYERTSPPIFRKDYLYWSAPVSPQRLVDLSPDTTPTKYFGNDGTQWVQTSGTTNMIVGKGYIIRGPDTYSNTVKATFTGIFKGVPNNGNLQGEYLSSGKSYLVGNPYPSALSADALISANTLLNGTLYFWTHNTPAQPTPTNQYTADDYASYNLSGGVSAISDPLHNSNPSLDNGVKPTGKIAAGQSFFVTTIAAGNVQFNNSMRLGGANNGQFFKSSKEATVEKKRIWINMTNTSGAFKQLLIAYIEGATNDYETNYDGISLNGNPYLDFYSVNNENHFVIQGRALPFSDSDIVPLGYRTTIAGDFTFSIDETDANMNEQAIYIEDKIAGVIHDLKQSNYTFSTTIGTFNDRFVLRYTNGTLGRGDFENTEKDVIVSVKNKSIAISSSAESIKEVSVFDITGKQLYNKKKVRAKELNISNLEASHQVLMVKVTLNNEFTETKKVVF